MRIRLACVAAGLVLAGSAPAMAQQQTGYVMATYYRCAQGDAAKADAIFKQHVTPFLKSEQAAGHIIAYGWGEHIEGGEWRRFLYVAGSDLGALADSRAAMVAMTQSADHAQAFEEFGRLCGSHNDYIWRSKAGSQTAESLVRNRAPYAMSTYYVCKSTEAEADALVTTAFAAELNKRVKDGTIASWSWMEHLFGGQFRRLLVVDGKDEKSLLANWATLMDDLEKASPDLLRRFSDICDSHADYIWKVNTN